MNCVWPGCENEADYVVDFEPICCDDLADLLAEKFTQKPTVLVGLTPEAAAL